VAFGIWVEPEMISEDSDLYREHPDWALTIPGREAVRSRNQLVLDFSRKEVRDTIFAQICDILDQGNITYLKWDVNRSLSDIYSKENLPGTVLYQYMIGLYEFLDKLTKRYPTLLIEGCSGGGGRFDTGMLAYTPQIWCSDNTDALDRLWIQYGTSFFYPVSTMGAHVSAVPNHMTGRSTSLDVRGCVAMAGTFGYELDPALLPEEEKEEIRRQVRTFKELQELISHGDYYRLSNPFRDNYAAWMMISQDKKECLLSVVVLENHANMAVNYVKLAGLDPQMIYRDQNGKSYQGAALMQGGIPVVSGMRDYAIVQLVLRGDYA
jgi:alpha-galactosidase